MQTLERCKCEKTAIYELLSTGMVGGTAQVITRYHEKDITRIRSHMYEEKSKLTWDIIVYDDIVCIFTVQVMQFPVAKTRWL